MAKVRPEINPAGIVLSKQSEVPLYRQLYDQLRAMLVEARLRPGDRLPASRILATELGVARVIVSQCYEQLIMEGYLVGKTGAGTFVADVLPDALLHTSATVKPVARTNKPPVADIDPCTNGQRGARVEVVPFQIGTPAFDQFPYKQWQTSGHKVLKDLKRYHLGYDDNFGDWHLRKAIAGYLRLSRAVHCEPEQVLVVTGSQQGVHLIVRSMLEPGDKVWMEDPGYQGALMAFRNAGVQACPVPIESDGMDVAYARRLFADARMAYVTPSHQFPLGCTLSYEKRQQLLDWASERDSWILEDDYDSEFRYDGRPLPSLQGMDKAGRVIYIGTFSKVLFPGLRLAYIVLPSSEAIARFQKAKYHIDRQSPVMDQLMLSEFMEGGYFLRHIRKMRLLYEERQRLLIDLVNSYIGEYVEVQQAPAGMHLVCWLQERVDSAKLQELTKACGIRVAFSERFKIEHVSRPFILLGFTAFSAYKMKVGMEKLKACFEASLP